MSNLFYSEARSVPGEKLSSLAWEVMAFVRRIFDLSRSKSCPDRHSEFTLVSFCEAFLPIISGLINHKVKPDIAENWFDSLKCNVLPARLPNGS